MTIEKLRTVIDSKLEKLEEMDPETEQYEIEVDIVSKLMDRLIEMEKNETDKADKAATQKLEKKDRLVKNIMTGVSIGGGLVLTVWGTITTLNFDKTDTITSSMGRGFVQRLFPKK